MRPWRIVTGIGLACVLLVASITPIGAIEQDPQVELVSTDVGTEVKSGPTVTPTALPLGDCAGGDIFDDGTAENGYRGPPTSSDTQFVMEFTPPSYPAVYETMCIGLTSNLVSEPNLEFTVQILDDDGATGGPGTVLAETDILEVDDIPLFPECRVYEIDISDLDAPVPSGSIYIGIRWNTMLYPRFVCADESPTTPLHTGFFNVNEGDGWDATESRFSGYRSLILRAVRDLEPPDTTITSGPADGSVVNEAIASFGFEANEPSTFECSVDGLPFSPCSGSGTHSTPALAEGPHAFAVRATDLGGNTDPFPDNRAFIVDALPDPTTTTTTTVPDRDFFIDDDDSIFEEDINAIAVEGITFGCNPPTNDMFCPDDSFLRGQAAAFLRRALSVDPSSTDFFIDDDNSVFESDINAVAQAGITFGCNPPENDRFCPDDSFLRGQAAAFLRRALRVPGSPTDFFVDDGNSVFEHDNNAVAEAGITFGCNPPENDRFCPDDAFLRGQAAAFLRRGLLP